MKSQSYSQLIYTNKMTQCRQQSKLFNVCLESEFQTVVSLMFLDNLTA